MKTKETYLKELNNVNKAIKEVESNYINALCMIGYEYLNNSHYTNRLDTLLIKKDKLMYLIALSDE